MKVAHLYVKNLHDTGKHFEEVRNVDSVHHMRNHIVVVTVKGEEYAFAADRVIEYTVTIEEE